MTLSMTNSEEIDGLNNRKFTGLFGLWQSVLRNQPNDKNKNKSDLDANYKEISEVNSKSYTFHIDADLSNFESRLKKAAYIFFDSVSYQSIIT